jgi:hypothetical protein
MAGPGARARRQPQSDPCPAPWNEDRCLSSAVERQPLIPVTVLADAEAGVERRVMSAIMAIESAVGARVQIEGIRRH